MLKLRVYGYATGVFSSYKIERRLHEDLAFRRLDAGNFPRRRTIRDFRALHLKELSDLFGQVVKLARQMGLFKLGTVAIDGTKIKANASRHKAMNYERMQQAKAELKAQIKRDRTASPGHSCSSASSTSTCSTARTAAVQSSRASRQSSSGKSSRRSTPTWTE